MKIVLTRERKREGEWSTQRPSAVEKHMAMTVVDIPLRFPIRSLASLIHCKPPKSSYYPHVPYRSCREGVWIHRGRQNDLHAQRKVNEKNPLFIVKQESKIDARSSRRDTSTHRRILVSPGIPGKGAMQSVEQPGLQPCQSPLCSRRR